MTVENVNKLVRLTALALFAAVVLATVVLAAVRLPTPPEVVFWTLVAVLGAGEVGMIGKRYTWKSGAAASAGGAPPEIRQRRLGGLDDGTEPT